MMTKDYQRRSPLMIFLSYFKNHSKLFAIDVLCAVGIAAIDLAFPLVTRSALYELLPNRMYTTFFTIMAAVVVSYLLRSFLNFIVAYYGHTFGIRVEADIRRDLFGCSHNSQNSVPACVQTGPCGYPPPLGCQRYGRSRRR